tara:strand:+ start:220 stop:471 length:252 start_codon:yes stop_codon:yes gene_type:complete
MASQKIYFNNNADLEPYNNSVGFARVGIFSIVLTVLMVLWAFASSMDNDERISGAQQTTNLSPTSSIALGINGITITNEFDRK